jgi:hypothetical protein
MSSRERRRAERQKRKRRSTQRAGGPSQPKGLPQPPITGASANGEPTPSRSEQRNREAREALEPLHEGERPGVVTVGAVICAVLAALSLLGYALWDVLRDDTRPPASGIVVFVALFGVMAWGMWRARYWAVLGFQTVLAIVLVLTAIGLIGATTVLQMAGNVVMIAAAGTLFYFMVRAMARIQMPERLPRG